MATGNITLPEEIRLDRRFWERNKIEAAKRRGSMTDEQIEEYVDLVIHECREESRER